LRITDEGPKLQKLVIKKIVLHQNTPLPEIISGF